MSMTHDNNKIDHTKMLLLRLTKVCMIIIMIKEKEQKNIIKECKIIEYRIIE